MLGSNNKYILLPYFRLILEGLYTFAFIVLKNNHDLYRSKKTFFLFIGRFIPGVQLQDSCYSD